MPPRRVWRRKTLRKLLGYGGHAVAQRDTRKSACTRTSAHGNTHYHSVHTLPLHTPRSREITGRSRRPGLAVSPDAPLQRLAQQAAAPAGPAQPSLGAARGGRGKGVCPRPLLRWERRVWEGRGPGGVAQAPIKIALRHGHKQTLPVYPLALQAACSPIFVCFCTSRGALHLQPRCWILSVLACSLGKPSGRLLPPGQDKDPQESLSSGCYWTPRPCFVALAKTTTGGLW